MNVPSHELCQRLIKLHSDLGESNGADRLDPLLAVLAENGLSGSDWPELFALCRMSSSQPKRLRRWVRGVHELNGRASAPGERRKARDGLIRRLLLAPISRIASPVCADLSVVSTFVDSLVGSQAIDSLRLCRCAACSGGGA